MNKKKTGSKTVSIRAVPEDVWRRITALARLRGLPVGQCVADALADYLRRQPLAKEMRWRP